ncbi:MAG: hypothetical protein KIT84_28460 [Labilithrix sp.]|nr:hypothetical protein [Labilithrix sp.]MCW5814992.1 hypothetical protein [Labilithrix sp.]
MTLDDVPREALVALAAVAIACALLLWVRGWLRGLAMRRRFDRGAEGEREAARLLEAAGFTIEGRQVAGGYTLAVDGAPVTIAVRADYLVSKAGARFVAEVKTGAVATRIETAATRRQLLEYQHAFEVAGVLLVDADAARVHRIEIA